VALAAAVGGVRALVAALEDLAHACLVALDGGHVAQGQEGLHEAAHVELGVVKDHALVDEQQVAGL
jgi:hypothetical protein